MNSLDPINVVDNINQLKDCIKKCEKELEDIKKKCETDLKVVEDQIKRYEGCVIVFESFNDKGFTNLYSENTVTKTTMNDDDYNRLRLLERVYWTDIDKPPVDMKSICSKDRERLRVMMHEKFPKPVENKCESHIHKHESPEKLTTINEETEKNDDDGLSLEELYKKYRTM